MKKLLIIALSLFMLGISASAKEYYVDCNKGLDYFYTGTSDRPFKTIQKAAKTVKAGDTVIVREGVYYGPITITAQGTAEKPISVEVKKSGTDDGVYNVYYVAAKNADKALLREGAEIYDVSGIGDGYIVTSYIRIGEAPEEDEAENEEATKKPSKKTTEKDTEDSTEENN